MNIPQLTPKSATYASAGSWLFNFMCQIYGMSTSPNMKDVAEKYHAFYSPHPFAIGLFFFPQSIIQVYWIYRLFQSSSSRPSLSLDDGPDDDGGNESRGSGGSSESESEAVRYAPVFVLGNVCIGTWMIFWNNEHLGLSDVFVNINSLAQLYYVFALLGPLTSESLLTHVVAKMFAGIGVLDVVDNASSAFLNYAFDDFHPGLVTYIVSVLAAVGLGFVSDPIFGAAVTYCWLGLVVGQFGEGLWAFVLLICAGITGGIVGIKAVKDRDLYQGLISGDSDSVL